MEPDYAPGVSRPAELSGTLPEGSLRLQGLDARRRTLARHPAITPNKVYGLYGLKGLP